MKNTTIFDNPVVRPVMRLLSRMALALAGWRVKDPPPDIPRYVLVCAPHTSNWDFVLLMLISFAYRMKVHSMMKQEMFRPPFDRIFHWLGAIPVNRGRSSNLVASMSEHFQRAARQSAQMILALSPPGTRSRARHWRTGFYRIAQSAGVPIVLGYLDYARRLGGFGLVLTPSGNIEADMAVIRNFYHLIAGRYPHKAVPPVLVPPSAP